MPDSKRASPPATPLVNPLGRTIYEPQKWRHELGRFGGRRGRYAESRGGLIRSFDPIRNCNVSFRRPSHLDHWLTLFLDPEVGAIELYPPPFKVVIKGKLCKASFHFRWERTSDGAQVLAFIDDSDAYAPDSLGQIYDIASAHGHMLQVWTPRRLKEEQFLLETARMARRLLTLRMGCDDYWLHPKIIKICREEGPKTRKELICRLMIEDDRFDYVAFWLYSQGRLSSGIKGGPYGDHTIFAYVP